MAFELYRDWAELMFVVALVIGFVLSVTVKFAEANYAILFFAGIAFGHLLYINRRQLRPPYFMIAAGFLAGYCIAVLHGSRILLLVFFLLGMITMMFLHAKNLIPAELK